MSRVIIQDWTGAHVWLNTGDVVDVRYRVYRNGKKHFLEMCDTGDKPIHTLELPAGVKLGKSSYEVFLRYILLDVVAA